MPYNETSQTFTNITTKKVLVPEVKLVQNQGFVDISLVGVRTGLLLGRL